MKRILALLLAASLCLGLTACGGSDNTELIAEYESRIAELESEVAYYEDVLYGTDESSDEESESESEEDTAWREVLRSLQGYWLADDGFWAACSWDYDENYESCCGELVFYASAFSYYVYDFEMSPDGTRLTAKTDDGQAVYEVSGTDGSMTLGYLESESSLSADSDYAAICRSFTVFPESSVQTVELTADNWQDYLELRYVGSEYRDTFDEFQFVNLNLCLCTRNDKGIAIVDTEDAAIELTGGVENYRWYTYDFATQEVTPGDPAAEGEVGSFFEPYEYTDICSFDWYDLVYGRDGAIVKSLSTYYAEVDPVLTEESYTFLAEDCATVTAGRVKGSIMVIG